MLVVYVSVAIIAGLLAPVAAFLMAKAGDKLEHGLLPYYFYFFFAGLGLMLAFTPKEFEGVAVDYVASNGGGLSEWLVRASSFMGVASLFAAAYRRLRTKRGLGTERAQVLLLFIIFWATTFVSPLFFGEYSSLSGVNAFYAPILFVTAILLLPEDAVAALRHLRFAALMFVLASFVFALAYPDRALYFGYSETQGYIPGVPRFYGLAPHAIGMASIAGAALWLFVIFPLQNKVAQRLALMVLSVALFLAQAKTAAATCLIGLLVIALYRKKKPSFNELATSGAAPVFASLFAIALCVLGWLLFKIGTTDYAATISRISASEEGGRLLSFTGRDVIWSVALDEWERYPIFGYGLDLFGARHRMEIGMSFATSGHNQFIDVLARAGLVGLVGVGIHFIGMFWMALKFSRLTQGVTLVIMISCLLRSITEIPFFAHGGFGVDQLQQLLLFLLLSSVMPESAASQKINGLSVRPARAVS